MTNNQARATLAEDITLIENAKTFVTNQHNHIDETDDEATEDLAEAVTVTHNAVTTMTKIL